MKRVILVTLALMFTRILYAQTVDEIVSNCLMVLSDGDYVRFEKEYPSIYLHFVRENDLILNKEIRLR